MTYTYTCTKCNVAHNYEDEIVYINNDNQDISTQDAQDYGYNRIECNTCFYGEEAITS